MAVVTTNAKIVTGSATNTLGTLGRSLFNSTIGVYGDKDEMNQIYNAIDKLDSSIETVDKTIDVEALNGRNKADDLFSLLAGLDIKSSSDFMNKNREFMKRLMRLNKQEKDITLDALGVDVTGDSNVVKNEYVRDYDHVKGNNYYEEYVKTLPDNQRVGDETTTLQLESSTNFNYAGLHNDLYVVNQNLYPDDDNQGLFANKWITENRNSLLYKTKKLFNSKKVNTIISRFHTDPRKKPSLLDNAKSKYGLSHGRNLLKKDAEIGYNTDYVNGYDNPYCRVWTHHHQYDRYYKTIRPFSHVDSQGNYVDTISVVDFHNWEQFSDKHDTNLQTRGKWGWKKSSNNGWQYSVLQDNGKVNITPKYINGQDTNIHTKQCMFSIENLAWRGYDPYSFEQALSWEQRGPLGGRIMWFPPYGISFNETTSTQWNSNTFLGRGEDVYTYTNTTRTGTLNFMMIVDHPSILDYVTWTKENQNATDTDILRFLAGCGEGYGGDGNDGNGGGGLRSLAKPTPLTDEYVQKHDEAYAAKIIEPAPTPEEEKPADKGFCFYVFYPNNYSGTYDDNKGDNYVNRDGSVQVDPIPYLIAGDGAQKVVGKDEDKPITEGDVNQWAGDGYEMVVGGKGLGKGSGYIVGTSQCYNSSSKHWIGRSKVTSYKKNPNKKWYYRIDGRYAIPSNKEVTSNYFNQTVNAKSYSDNKSYGLNNDISVLKRIVGDEVSEDYKLVGDKLPSLDVYTLAEVAYVLYEGNAEKQKKCRINVGDKQSMERIEKLKELLSEEKKAQIKSVIGRGGASIHGYKKTNEVLGEHRAETAVHWFMSNISLVNPTVDTKWESVNDIGTKTSSDSNRVGGSVTGDASSENAKRWRYARVVVSYETTGSTTPSQSGESVSDNIATNTNTDSVVKNTEKKEYLGYTKTSGRGMYNGKEYDIYTDKNGKKWYKVDEGDGEIAKFVSVGYAAEEESEPIQRYGNNHGDENRLRYDQEYHFFKVLKQEDPVVFNSLMDKLQYFDPAFHSMTPEGFNGRLTFLQQCMRQGNTVSASDGKFEKSANNLAFGRAPYCVLRLGDFYNQMIVIDNLSISYDPLVWDLNVEGVGVQPLIANVSLSFKFVGGGDLTGPVRRLQNAMSFNYYANARLYDNRADRIERKWSDKTCGAIEHDEILDDSSKSENFNKTYNIIDKKTGEEKVSTFYNTQMFQ